VSISRVTHSSMRRFCHRLPIDASILKSHGVCSFMHATIEKNSNIVTITIITYRTVKRTWITAAFFREVFKTTYSCVLLPNKPFNPSLVRSEKPSTKNQNITRQNTPSAPRSLPVVSPPSSFSHQARTSLCYDASRRERLTFYHYKKNYEKNRIVPFARLQLRTNKCIDIYYIMCIYYMLNVTITSYSPYFTLSFSVHDSFPQRVRDNRVDTHFDSLTKTSRC